MEETGVGRRVEYYIKNMDIDDCRAVIYALQRNFPSFYKRYVEAFNDDFVKIFISKRQNDCKELNEFVRQRGGQPFFKDTNKITECWRIRDELLKMRPLKELEEEFGASIEEFKPEEFFKNNKDSSSASQEENN